jgi:hypothetical protein
MRSLISFRGVIVQKAPPRVAKVELRTGGVGGELDYAWVRGELHQGRANPLAQHSHSALLCGVLAANGQHAGCASMLVTHPCCLHIHGPEHSHIHCTIATSCQVENIQTRYINLHSDSPVGPHSAPPLPKLKTIAAKADNSVPRYLITRSGTSEKHTPGSPPQQILITRDPRLNLNQS